MSTRSPSPFPGFAPWPALLALLVLPACKVAYVGRSAWFQLELMAKREPIDRVLAQGGLGEEQARKLALVPEIKTFGEEQGLAPSRNYESVSARWDRSLYNFSACGPLSLEPEGWWFPVVGSVPYLGFFRERDVRRYERRYRDRGFDVWVRDVGAYSTLGWFRDPVLPAMLDWEEFRLAEVVLHELVHATLWVPGSVSFNETLANVVGEEAATRWMVERYGIDSPEVRDMARTRADWVLWRGLLEELYKNLDAVYKNENTNPETKLENKHALFEGLEASVLATDFHQQARYASAAHDGPWNNARIAQYRTYNQGREAFDTLLGRHGGDLPTFMADIAKITEKRRDPWAALHEELDENEGVRK